MKTSTGNIGLDPNNEMRPARLAQLAERLQQVTEAHALGQHRQRPYRGTWGGERIWRWKSPSQKQPR